MTDNAQIYRSREDIFREWDEQSRKTVSKWEQQDYLLNQRLERLNSILASIEAKQILETRYLTIASIIIGFIVSFLIIL